MGTAEERVREVREVRRHRKAPMAATLTVTLSQPTAVIDTTHVGKIPFAVHGSPRYRNGVTPRHWVFASNFDSINHNVTALFTDTSTRVRVRAAQRKVDSEQSPVRSKCTRAYFLPSDTSKWRRLSHQRRARYAGESHLPSRSQTVFPRGSLKEPSPERGPTLARVSSREQVRATFQHHWLATLPHTVGVPALGRGSAFSFHRRNVSMRLSLQLVSMSQAVRRGSLSIARHARYQRSRTVCDATHEASDSCERAYVSAASRMNTHLSFGLYPGTGSPAEAFDFRSASRLAFDARPSSHSNPSPRFPAGSRMSLYPTTTEDDEVTSSLWDIAEQIAIAMANKK